MTLPRAPIHKYTNVLQAHLDCGSLPAFIARSLFREQSSAQQGVPNQQAGNLAHSKSAAGNSLFSTSSEFRAKKS